MATRTDDAGMLCLSLFAGFFYAAVELAWPVMF
jgi:hypothetical protein